MDTITWIVLGIFLLFCGIMVATDFVKPIPPADQKKENEKEKVKH